MASVALSNSFLGLTDQRIDISTVNPETNSAGFFAQTAQVPLVLEVQARAGRVVRTFKISVRSSSLPDWLEKSAQQIGTVMLLPANWDHRGSLPVQLTAVQTAVDALPLFMDSNTASPQWTPTPAGGVQLDWHQSGIDLEMTFDPGSEGYAVFSDHRDSDAEWDGTITENLKKIREIVSARLNVVRTR